MAVFLGHSLLGELRFGCVHREARLEKCDLLTQALHLQCQRVVAGLQRGAHNGTAFVGATGPVRVRSVLTVVSRTVAAERLKLERGLRHATFRGHGGGSGNRSRPATSTTTISTTAGHGITQQACSQKLV